MTTDKKLTGKNADNSDAPQEINVQSVTTEKLSPASKKRWPWPVKIAFGVAAAGTAYAGYAFIHDELAVSSTLQSKFLTQLYKGEIFTKTVTTPPPAEGNTDVERGYSEIQRIRKQAEAAGDIVSPQVPWQDRQIGPLRLAPIFPRPQQAGISMRDTNGVKMYESRTPYNVYKKYEDIPGIIVKSLCAVEDKNICDPDKAPTFNASINWWRASQAAAMGIGKKMHIVSRVEGGSTLPIQITKNDSWEKGRTKGFIDKAEQMLTASTEMYALGLDTREMRKNKILEYINTASFAGHPQFGEMKGIDDARRIIFGHDIEATDEKLKKMEDDEETALIFREVFTLIMAVKEPDESLRSREGFKANQERFDNFMGVLVKEGAITQSFADRARALKIDYDSLGKNPQIDEKMARAKSIDSMRLSVMNKLKLGPVDGMYKQDRWDLSVDSTLDLAVTDAITRKFTQSYQDPEGAKKNGLIGFQMLRPETAPKVTWAFTLNEHLPDGRVVTRVNTDTYKGALDLTKGGRQNYGSTGKKRMATTHLEIIAELHDQLAHKSIEELKAMEVTPRDKLTRKAVDYLSNPDNDRSLKEMQKSLVRTVKYSGRPQGFFTGGGMNYPGNFDRREDSKSYTVEEALWESVNLSWYRITDEDEEFMKWNRLGIDPGILDDGPFTPAQLETRRKYLEEFADYEGTVFSGRFWRQQKNRIASELAASLANKDADHPVHMTGLYRGFYPESSFEEYARFMNQFCKGCGDKNKLRTLFDDNKKKSKSSAASLLAAHTDGSVSSLITLFRYTTPHASYDQTKAFVLSLKKDIDKDVDLTDEFSSYKSPVPQAVLDLLVEKTKGARTKLAVVYTTLYPDASFEDFESFMRRECKTCGPKDDLRKLYNEHRAERQIDILSAMVKKADQSPASLIKLYLSIDPAVSYQTVRAHIAKQSPETDPFKDFTKEFDAAKKENTPYSLGTLATYTDRSPVQLAALYGRLKPGTSLEDMKQFIQQEVTGKKLKPDYKALYERYGATPYNPNKLFFRFNLNDRGYLTRPIHPLELAIAAHRIQNPEISWKQAIEQTLPDRIHVYKWLIQSNKKPAQDKSIGIMLDQHAWREIGKQWQSVGYPFKLVPSLATVIGVSGDTAESLATLNSIFLAGGKSVTTTRISDLHFAVGTPHETHIRLGQPKSKQVIRPETAELMLEMTQGVVSSEHGTGRRLKEGFKLSDGTVLAIRGKTGTNDESETSGIRVGAFAGTMGDRFSFCLSGYITGATSKDKFTSGIAVQALKMLLPELRPLIERSYGIAPAQNIISPENGTSKGNSVIKLPRPPEKTAADYFPALKQDFSVSALLDYDTGAWYMDKMTGTLKDEPSKTARIPQIPAPVVE